jgi:hypothetical protein
LILIATLESRWDDRVQLIRDRRDSGFSDPEAFFQWAGALAMAGDQNGARSMLERAIEGGFYPVSPLATYPNLGKAKCGFDISDDVFRPGRQ